MFGKPKKRLVKVIVTLRHGTSLGHPEPDIVDEIDIEEGQKFKADFGHYTIEEHGHIIRRLDYRAGYTEDVAYQYEEKE